MNPNLKEEKLAQGVAMTTTEKKKKRVDAPRGQGIADTHKPTHSHSGSDAGKVKIKDTDIKT